MSSNQKVKSLQPQQERDDQALPPIEDFLVDPAASHWFKAALASAITRDPVDAANEAEVLSRLLNRRAETALRESIVHTIR